MPFSAALYSQEPAGTAKVACQTPSSASNASCDAGHGGCQSSGQPSSVWRLPAIVTVEGSADAAGAVTATKPAAASVRASTCTDATNFRDPIV